ncbi:MBL fold metallo-hydrolase [Halobellus sp. GM3]|uniref:MBL fold metallo-hydrolase n=1 Tax=Halobellus sp. GM3 TaxID=3458410 RepID=UPI00403D8567
MTRIPLGSTVFEGENNAYLVDGTVTTLIDVGGSMPSIRSNLLDGLADADVALEDVDRILLTHWHADHSGLAGELQAETGATVFAHEADVPLIARDDDAVAELEDLRIRRFEQWGIPEAKLEELLEFRDGFETVGGEPAAVDPLSDGDRVAAGDGELTVHHLPGHAAGLVAFAFETTDGGANAGDVDGVNADEVPNGSTEAFVGDAILPQYTPNVGGADLRVDRPLEQYIDSLDRLIECDLDWAWPGHRDPIEDPSERARVIRSHHVERTRRVVEALREHGPGDAWTVSAHLFGELESIHILHGPGEAYAHLDHLERAGVVERDDWTYRLVDADPDVSALF